MLVLGSGIAGMSTALHLSKLGKVTILTQSTLLSGSTPLAQGGIAGVIDEKDSFESHIQDTMKAGGYANNREAVEILVKNAPQEIKFLEDLGVEFENKQHLEGGHSFPRVSNIKDISGKIIAEVLASNVLKNKNITVIENADVCEIHAKNKNISYIQNDSNQIHTIAAEYIVIATGGYSALYQNSTAPHKNLGDGISLCIKAGIVTKDLEKVQFHPTVLNKKRKNNLPPLLLTEAIRGFGATIINNKEEIIIDALKPRDIVSKAIYDEEKKQNNKNCVFLDTRNINNFNIKFPFISKILHEEFHLNPQNDLLPITFGAHYCMGGIKTDIWGQTSEENIYAVGECANTGVHGNNRLASNSLLEGLVFARQIAKHIKKKINKNTSKSEQKTTITTAPLSNNLDTHIKHSQYNLDFLEKIKTTLSLYISIETNPQKKIENINTAIKIFNEIKNSTEYQYLSEKNKNILTLSQKLANDAINNV